MDQNEEPEPQSQGRATPGVQHQATAVAIARGSISRDVTLVIASLFLGAGLAPFVTPYVAVLLGAIGGAIVAAVLTTPHITRDQPAHQGTTAIGVFLLSAIILSIAGVLLAADHAPQVKASLQQHDPKTAVAYLGSAVADCPSAYCAMYRLEIQNLGPADVLDLHVTTYLHENLAADPFIIDATRAEIAKVKPGYTFVTVTPVGENAIRLAGYSNMMIAEATRLRSDGSIVLGVPVNVADRPSPWEPSNVGKVVVRSRHTYHNTIVDDLAAFAIIDTRYDVELLDPHSTGDPVATVLGPKIGGEAFERIAPAKAGEVRMEVHLE